MGGTLKGQIAASGFGVLGESEEVVTTISVELCGSLEQARIYLCSEDFSNTCGN